VAQGLQEGAARRIGECGVRAIEQLIFNHSVDYTRQSMVC
jgi:hypothetical protein